MAFQLKARVNWCHTFKGGAHHSNEMHLKKRDIRHAQHCKQHIALQLNVLEYSGPVNWLLKETC